jgi:hypothetical protein
VKLTVTTSLGLLVAIIGFLLRVSAMKFSRPLTTSWSPGSWEATDWAFWQRTWTDVGNILFSAGLLLLLIAIHHWNNAKENLGGAGDSGAK